MRRYWSATPTDPPTPSWAVWLCVVILAAIFLTFLLVAARVGEHRRCDALRGDGNTPALSYYGCPTKEPTP